MVVRGRRVDLQAGEAPELHHEAPDELPVSCHGSRNAAVVSAERLASTR